MRMVSNLKIISGLGCPQQNNAATYFYSESLYKNGKAFLDKQERKTFRSVSKFQNNNTIVVRAQELRSNFLYQTSQDFLNIQYMSESN